eukprot:126018-Pelagomonas_calceolata.AAC.2
MPARLCSWQSSQAGATHKAEDAYAVSSMPALEQPCQSGGKQRKQELMLKANDPEHACLVIIHEMPNNKMQTAHLERTLPKNHWIWIAAGVCVDEVFVLHTARVKGRGDQPPEFVTSEWTNGSMNGWMDG